MEKETEEEFCRLRRQAYGLSACQDCPLSCVIAENNINLLSNAELQIAELLTKEQELKDFYGSNAKPEISAL